MSSDCLVCLTIEHPLSPCIVNHLWLIGVGPYAERSSLADPGFRCRDEYACAIPTCVLKQVVSQNNPLGKVYVHSNGTHHNSLSMGTSYVKLFDGTFRRQLRLARHTPCDFCRLLDAETTKRRLLHGVCAPKTIVAR